MPAYVIAYLDVIDPSALEEYRRAVVPTFARFGGKPLAVDWHCEVLDGLVHPRVVVIVVFESLEHARNWHESAEHRQTIPLRQRAAHASVVLANGIPAPAPSHRA